MHTCAYQYINSSINLKVFTMCSPMVIHLYCNPVFILIWTKDEGRSEMASLPLQDFSNDNEDIRPSNRSSGLVNRCKRSKQDDTIQILFFDSNFNLVEEAHNAEVVLLDSTFQWCLGHVLGCVGLWRQPRKMMMAHSV